MSCDVCGDTGFVVDDETLLPQGCRACHRATCVHSDDAFSETDFDCPFCVQHQVSAQVEDLPPHLRASLLYELARQSDPGEAGAIRGGLDLAALVDGLAPLQAAQDLERLARRAQLKARELRNQDAAERGVPAPYPAAR